MAIEDPSTSNALVRDLRDATRLRCLSCLSRGIAHDLKAPLNAMVMNFELLKQTLRAELQVDDLAAARSARYLDTLSNELMRLNRHLDTFLELASPSPDVRSPTELRELVDVLQKLIAPQARQQRVKLDFELPDRPVVVTACGAQLREAILSIVVNALEAMPAGGELRISLAADDGRGRVSVTDTGPGISSPDINRIFDMHFSTKDSGTGIGLYVVWALIEKNGGTIEIATEPGAGTRFEISLPLADHHA